MASRLPTANSESDPISLDTELALSGRRHTASKHPRISGVQPGTCFEIAGLPTSGATKRLPRRVARGTQVGKRCAYPTCVANRGLRNFDIKARIVDQSTPKTSCGHGTGLAYGLQRVCAAAGFNTARKLPGSLKSAGAEGHRNSCWKHRTSSLLELEGPHFLLVRPASREQALQRAARYGRKQQLRSTEASRRRPVGDARMCLHQRRRPSGSTRPGCRPPWILRSQLPSSAIRRCGSALDPFGPSSADQIKRPRTGPPLRWNSPRSNVAGGSARAISSAASRNIARRARTVQMPSASGALQTLKLAGVAHRDVWANGLAQP